MVTVPLCPAQRMEEEDGMLLQADDTDSNCESTCHVYHRVYNVQLNTTTPNLLRS